MKRTIILIAFVVTILISLGFFRRTTQPAKSEGFLSKILKRFEGRQLPVSKTPITTGTLTATSPSPRTNPAVGGNPFGVMISGSTSQIKAQTAVKLGAKYYRPISIFLDRWTGTCEECGAAVISGLKLILTVRNNNGGPQNPTTPPTDLDSFKSTLSRIVDNNKPEVLVIENEENSAALFYNGTAPQYLEELRAGCEVAHQRSIKCANGGLVSSLVAVLVSENYKANGDIKKADEYLDRTLIGAKQSMISQINSAKGQEQITKGKELLAGYKTAGADFMNFHWYIADAEALAEAVSYLRTASGLPVITNEVGQQANTDSSQVTNVMQKIVTLGLPYALWFSMDTNPPDGARALNETNGSLRPNGEAFRNFIKAQNFAE